MSRKGRMGGARGDDLRHLGTNGNPRKYAKSLNLFVLSSLNPTDKSYKDVKQEF